MSARASLFFAVPAHGRLELARICLAQLARTCAGLAKARIDAQVVVIAEDANLETAAELGFVALERPNSGGLGRKFNDGFEHAARAGADYVVPFGSDDWAVKGLFERLPAKGTVGCARLAALVSEDGRKLMRIRVPYAGGLGVRIFPVGLLRPLGYRPAEEERERAIDSSIFRRLRNPPCVYRELHGLQLVDFKSSDAQLNAYRACAAYREAESSTPFEDLAAIYPGEAVSAVQALYAGVTA